MFKASVELQTKGFRRRFMESFSTTEALWEFPCIDFLKLLILPATLGDF